MSAGQYEKLSRSVKERGDTAVKEYTNKFDHYNPQSFRLSETFIAQQAAQCPAEVKTALEVAAQRIVAFHEKQLPQNIAYTDAVGVNLGLNWVALPTVGIYVPGGLASYPSSLLMNVLPAKIAVRIILTGLLGTCYRKQNTTRALNQF